LREVKFRGVVSAAMIYDTQPVIDHFRLADANTVAGQWILGSCQRRGLITSI
jgi:hypothetical protein